MDKEQIGIPKLRFPGFTGAWEQRKLGEVIVSEHKGKVKSSMKGGNTNYLETNYLNGGIAQKVNVRADVSKNDVLILWDGSKAGTVYHGFEGALGSTLKAYVPKCSGDFLYQILKKDQDKIYQRYRTPNIPHVIKNFTEKFIVLIPDVREQEKIAEFFNQLDSLIVLHQRKLEHLKQQKNGLLQKMFPKNGESVPEVRFPGFTAPWEQRKLGDFGKVAMNKRIFKNQTSDEGDVPFYKIGTFGGVADSYITKELFEEYKLKYPYPRKGDLLISASGSIGRVIEYSGKDEYFQDSNIVWLDHDNRLDNSFLKQFYNIIKWQGLEGSTIKRLYNKNILATKIDVPSISEQLRIGDFFQQFDFLIALQQRRIEHLELLKKGLLQQMFV